MKVIPISSIRYDVYSPFQKVYAVQGLKSRHDAQLWIDKFKAHCYELKKQSFSYPLVIKIHIGGYSNEKHV